MKKGNKILLAILLAIGFIIAGYGAIPENKIATSEDTNIINSTTSNITNDEINTTTSDKKIKIL